MYRWGMWMVISIFLAFSMIFGLIINYFCEMVSWVISTWEAVWPSGVKIFVVWLTDYQIASRIIFILGGEREKAESRKITCAMWHKTLVTCVDILWCQFSENKVVRKSSSIIRKDYPNLVHFDLVVDAAWTRLIVKLKPRNSRLLFCVLEDLLSKSKLASLKRHTFWIRGGYFLPCSPILIGATWSCQKVTRYWKWYEMKSSE